jgi:hypothetical protein
VRRALKKKPGKFNSLGDALGDVSSRLTIPIREYMKMSEILKQRKLSEYF